MSDSGDAEAEVSSTSRLTDSKKESKKKLIRLLTVMAYVSSVSMAAVMLSMYYIFLWVPKVPEHHLRADPNGPLALTQDLDQEVRYEGGYPDFPEMYPPPRPLWPQSHSLVLEEGAGRAALFLQRIATAAPIRAVRTPPPAAARSSTSGETNTTTTAISPMTPGLLATTSSGPSTSPPPSPTSPSPSTTSSAPSPSPSAPLSSPSPDPVIQWLSGGDAVNITAVAWMPDELEEQPSAT